MVRNKGDKDYTDSEKTMLKSMIKDFEVCKMSNHQMMEILSRKMGRRIKESFFYRMKKEVNEEPVDNLAILEEQNERNDIPFSEIKTTGRNPLVDVAMKEISRKFLVNRSNPLNADNIIKIRHLPTDRTKSYPAMYLSSLLSKGVKILNEDFRFYHEGNKG
jgi:hypothetical protein